MKIYGVVVLYNPERSIIENIGSYIYGLEKLCVIDNSEKYNEEIADEVRRTERCEYIGGKGNIGIARALNDAANIAIAEGADWLLTMDQDSRFDEGSFLIMEDWIIKNLSIIKRIGLIAPLHVDSNNIRLDIARKQVEECIAVMSSGNIINLKAYSAVKGFEEKLFVDAVDYDYCLKLGINGYKVIRLNHIKLNHKLGERKKIIFLGKERFFNSHDYKRKYYIARNNLYIWFKYYRHYPGFILKEILLFRRNISEIILFSKNKSLHFKFLFLGFLDFFRGKFGKYDGK